MEQVDFLTINSVPSSTLQIISSFWVRANDVGEPIQFIMSCTLDREKAGCCSPEFPIYIPATSMNFKGIHHEILRQEFDYGRNPFAGIKCINFKWYKDIVNGEPRYYGYADDFEALTNEEVKLELEDWLDYT